MEVEGHTTLLPAVPYKAPGPLLPLVVPDCHGLWPVGPVYLRCRHPGCELVAYVDQILQLRVDPLLHPLLSLWKVRVSGLRACGCIPRCCSLLRRQRHPRQMIRREDSRHGQHVQPLVGEVWKVGQQLWGDCVYRQGSNGAQPSIQELVRGELRQDFRQMLVPAPTPIKGSSRRWATLAVQNRPPHDARSLGRARPKLDWISGACEPCCVGELFQRLHKRLGSEQRP